MVNTEVYDLPHSVEQRGAMASRIARAVLNFQDQLLEADANTGSLCQVIVYGGNRRLALPCWTVSWLCNPLKLSYLVRQRQ